MRHSLYIILISCLCTQMLIVPFFAHSEEKTQGDTEAIEVPTKPSAPPSFDLVAPKAIFGCQRKYTYKGHSYDCDSMVARDAERLRSIFNDVPGAVNELNEYQKTKQIAKNTAYVVSAGAAAILAGLLVGRVAFGAGNHASTLLRDVTSYAGIWIGTNGFLYNVALLRANEEHLDRAIDIYNQARPETPIGLQMTIPLPLDAKKTTP